uniref:Uncharacterized protein n=1 Tax=Arundo donax TaxID=35708 RepID=A0A0A9EV46_ARUDO
MCTICFISSTSLSHQFSSATCVEDFIVHSFFQQSVLSSVVGVQAFIHYVSQLIVLTMVHLVTSSAACTAPKNLPRESSNSGYLFSWHKVCHIVNNNQSAELSI